MNETMFTMGNSKIPNNTACFSLPAIKSCPNSTKECRKYCYGLKSERMYPSVRDKYAKNFQLSKRKDFVPVMIDQIKRKKNKIKKFRIHVNGDFYSQAYFNKWIAICLEFPDIQFTAYTRNFRLHLENKLPNFILFYTDENLKKTQKSIKQRGFDGRAVVLANTNKPEHKKPREHRGFICGGSCFVCNFCYERDFNFKEVRFIKH